MRTVGSGTATWHVVERRGDKALIGRRVAFFYLGGEEGERSW